MHPLDNPPWTALTTHQSAIALVEGMARRFPPEMAAHGALALPMPQAWESLARLARTPVCLFSAKTLALPPGWTVTRHIELLEMVHEDGSGTTGAAAAAGGAAPDISELKDSDVPEMSVLYEATRPGRRMCPRNLKLGTFLGARCEGKLVAMGGLRMHLPGYREITTVGTMPGFEGRGYSTAVVAALAERIRARNEQPFLTVNVDNPRAIAIYHRLGFRERMQLHSTTVVYGSR
jgi:ribosomal protein S18 acetylase RimI-like enzyme